ncbi:GTPase HflX [Gemmata sp. JC673]|uniref:GTPase HflX n=1 Tax=Gemmata algarum TaxID=2975278 RepID=A0ABU5EXI3_9BACT|nr:GTPase HflX [Gemmata algarum]
MIISKAFDTQREEFSVASERAVLVSVALPERPWPNEADPCDEIRGLAETAGATSVAELTQRRHDIQLATYLGTGKVGELHDLVESADADVVIFDNDLLPNQARNLEQALGVKVLDRSELILDIFASRARTAESKLQVELAQLEYSLPRLKQMWSHLSRQKGGGIGLRGPGETQLETDRRLVQHRIRDLKRKLDEVLARKEREVKSRAEEHTVSLVGYTNAGKSQLMHALTKADVYVKNQLFSTLDTRTRQWHIRDWGRVLLSDTVGFIRDLPHHLVASFKATLSEARHAKLLLHVVDASSPQAEVHIRAVNNVLKELDCGDRPTLLVLNKVDKLQDRSLLTLLEAHHPRAVTVSGLTGEGLDQLEDAVMEALAEDFAEAEIVTDSGNGRVLAFLNAHAEIYRQEFRDDANEVVIRCHLPKHLLHHIAGPTVQVRFVERTGRPEAAGRREVG